MRYFNRLLALRVMGDLMMRFEYNFIRLESKSCRILPLAYGTKYDMT